MKQLVVLLLGWVAGSSLGCNTVLGIEKAHVDQRLVNDKSKVSSSGTLAEGDTPLETGKSGKSATHDSGVMTTDSGTQVKSSDDSEQASVDASTPDKVEAEQDASSAVSGDTESDVSEDDVPDAGVLATEAAAPVETEPSLCGEYCANIMDLCTGDLTQYRDMKQCMTICELLPQGDLTEEDDESENSVACRLRAASRARYAGGTELGAYCREAGPGGDGLCGSNCDGYCTLMMAVCTPDVTDIYRYDTTEECMQVCEALPPSSVGYSTVDPDVSDGNHVQCRLFHVASAAMLDAEEHCEHAMGLVLCEEL